MPQEGYSAVRQENSIKQRIAPARVLLFLLAAFFFAWHADAATMTIQPESGIYRVGKTFTATIKLNTEGQVVNAAQGELDFSRDTDKMEVISISRAGSAFTLWAVEPVFNNQAGKIEFAGGIPTPGFVGSNGTVLTITFRPKTAGSALLLFSRGAVLLNDGKGTNVLSRLAGASYTFEASSFVPRGEEAVPPPRAAPVPRAEPGLLDVRSPSHPKENEWYSNTSPEFIWQIPESATGISFAFNKKQAVDPGPVSDGLFERQRFDNVANGVWFFHIKYRTERGWSGIRHRRVQIDSAPPEIPHLANVTQDPTDPRPTFELKVEDALSGVVKVMMKVGDGDFYEIPSKEREIFLHKLPPQYFGTRTLTARAYDRAGNYRDATLTFTVAPIEKPVFLDVPGSVDTLTDIIVTCKSRSGYRIKGILVPVRQGSESSLTKETTTKENGICEVNFAKFLPPGRYRVSLQAFDERGAYSEVAEGGEIRVESAIIKIGRFVITYGAITLLLLLVLAFLVAVVIWLWYKIQMIRLRVRKEVREAEETLHRGFEVLIKNLRVKIQELEKKSTSRALTEEEEQLKRTLETSLRIIEKNVEREIRDIEEKTSGLFFRKN
jgi:hypothetical protein